MKKNNKIIDFFEGNMNETEKEEFFRQMQDNSELKNEFEDYKKLYYLLNHSKSFKPNENYLDSIVPKFRSKSKRTFLNFKPVFASGIFLLFISLSVLLYYTLNFDNENGLNELDVLYEISSLETENSDYFSLYFESGYLDELLLSKLDEKENNYNPLKNYLHFENDYSFISESLAKDIYDELLTKKIL